MPLKWCHRPLRLIGSSIYCTFLHVKLNRLEKCFKIIFIASDRSFVRLLLRKSINEPFYHLSFEQKNFSQKRTLPNLTKMSLKITFLAKCPFCYRLGCRNTSLRELRMCHQNYIFVINPHFIPDAFYWGHQCSWTLTRACRSPTCSLLTILSV